MGHRGLLKGYLLTLVLSCLAWAPLAVQAAVKQEGTLVIALDTLGAQSMDPIQESRSAHAHYQAPMYDGILWFNPEKGGAAPGVAERWELAKDGLSWIFHIRKGMKWHNGDPVTAHDVKFSIERTMSKGSLASRAAAVRRDVQRIDVIDDYTVQVFTKGVQVHFAEGLSRATYQEGQLMPKKYIETVGEEEFRKKPIGSGPWKFVRSVPGDRIEYEAIDYPHFRGTPNFKRLVILLIPEESTRVAMVSTGEAAIASISPESIKEAKALRLKVVSVPGTMQAVYQMYGMTLKGSQKNPLADPRVRQALSLAIDRKKIIEHVMYGEARMPMPFATFGYSVDISTDRWQKWSAEAFRYDPKRAKQLLAEAGYANGFPLNFAITALAGTPFMVPIGLAVADFWNKIGIKVTYKNYEYGAFAPMVRGDQKQLVGAVSMFRTAGRPVAAARYFGGFNSKGAHHLFGYGEDCPELCQSFDKLHKAVTVETDAKKRMELTDQMVKLVADSWIAVPILEGMGYWAVNPGMVGAFKAIPGRHEFGDVFERMPRVDQKRWN
jgi:ABC-type transport system substrate-binding protein